MPHASAPFRAELEADIALAGQAGVELQVALRRHPRSRRLRLIVDERGARVTAPPRASRRSIERFVADHRMWIEREVSRHALTALPPPQVGVDDTLTLRGERVDVRWLDRPMPNVLASSPGLLHIGTPMGRADALARGLRALRGWMVAEATRNVAECNDAAWLRVGARASRVRLRCMRTLWGSLSVDGSMRIDLALLLAPPEILDYVVVHEVCHCHERNHSARFWAHVARAHPDYAHHRRWLRAHGSEIKSELARWSWVP